MGEQTITALDNAFLRVGIAEHGAELVSVFDKKENGEMLWQADPACWGRHAPILFPFVGRPYDGKFRYRGKTYPMGQHGFARDMAFIRVRADDTEAVFVLTDSPETRAVYPFAFRLQVSYEIEDNRIAVGWKVTNPSDREPLLFSIGAHPGFRVPFDGQERKEDYRILFFGPEGKRLQKIAYKLILPDGSGVDDTHIYAMDIPETGLPAREELFEKDALILENGQVSAAALIRPGGKPYIRLSCPDFPFFGLWSKPGAHAPFICLEPWYGRADGAGFSGELQDRVGEIMLEPGEEFETGYDIFVGK